ncbi:MAG: ThiF family adenylyltransferase [Chloroflexi bacterium]|nr:ThiF family adenylyltransferase [Chloroflexota bacterium]
MNEEYSIRITEEDFERARSLVMADLPKEGAAFLLAGRRRGNDGEALIVRRVVEIPRSEYRVQEDYHLEISTRAINGLVALCEKNRLGAILCHSHPTISPYSSSDDFGEKRIAETLWQFLPDVPGGSLLISPEGIQGRRWQQNGTNTPVSSLTTVGRCLTVTGLNGGSPNISFEGIDMYSRQIQAFGMGGQRRIASTKVGVVGLGGTGSATAEQLIRLGVKNLVLIDKDVFEPSNLNRVYGSVYADAYPRHHWWLPWRKRKIPKVELAFNHLKRINPDAMINTIQDSVVRNSACSALLDRDVIFCCTDDNWGRSVINQVAYQFLIPVINMGMRIDSKDEKIAGAAGSVHVLRPGKPCLWCYEFLRADRIRAESLPSTERDSLLREGYVENVDTPAPSVVPLTTTVAGLAVTQFLQLVTDFMGPGGDVSCLQYFMMEGIVRRGTRGTNTGCICQAVKGYGDLKALPVT